MGQHTWMMWASLAFVLFLLSFGLTAPILLLAYIAAFCGGAFLVVYKLHAVKESEAVLHRITPVTQLQIGLSGILQVVEMVSKSDQDYKCDKRLTGSNIIDEQLQEVLELAFRDYIHDWYYQLSDHKEFLYNARQTTQSIIITFANRSKNVDWVDYTTRKTVDDFASHLRLFRKAQDKLRRQRLQEDFEDKDISIEDIFFDLELEMEKDLCRDRICTKEEHEIEYLQSICELLLFLLLPADDFHSKHFRFIIRELVVFGVIRPIIEMVVDPDYINQTIVWWCKDSTFTTEAFLTVIKMASTIDELHAVNQILDTEIAKQRSKDANKKTDDGSESDAKQQLNSLQFVKKLCVLTIKRKNDGEDFEQAMEAEVNGVENDYSNLYSLPFNVVLNNNIALSHFIEFLGTIDAQSYLHFYLTVESYRVTAEQKISAIHLQRKHPSKASSPELETLRKEAWSVFEQYLTEDSPHLINLGDDTVVKRTHQRIKLGEPSETVFDEAQKIVHKILQEDQHYLAFKQSSSYRRCLAELDLLTPKTNGKLPDDDNQFDSSPDSSIAASSEDLSSFGSTDSLDNFSMDSDLSADASVNINAEITEAIPSKDPAASGKMFTLYVIRVTRTDHNDHTEIWDVYRRFSDFHDLHMRLTEKYDNIDSLQLPSKRAFMNMNKSFLDKRIKSLTSYVKKLLLNDMWLKYPGMLNIILNFLEPGEYSRGKSKLARKNLPPSLTSNRTKYLMDHIVNPLKNVAHSVKSMPGSLVDGVSAVGDKMSDSLNKVIFSKPQLKRIKKPSLASFRNLSFRRKQQFTPRSPLMETGKVSEVLDMDETENIPLRIMLLLMDEVFDLRCRDQWLRRRVVAFLRQIIKATLGNKINGKIVEQVENITSPEQLAYYVKHFRDSFWPNGILAEEQPERDELTKLRTRVAAKTKLLGNVPDELKNFIGADTTRRGILRMFEMLQNKTFNKRFVYVCLEGYIETVFPENKFPETFRKLHSLSQRVRDRPKETLKRSGSARSRGNWLMRSFKRKQEVR
ncbi:sorting nexin-13-like isoform X2 [Anneissia japonica]|uniref:sorting nexin-13-like isoform X2 n=1 Tax=Anneissia japonica TaxID=1529436 RepID=UPI00142597BB|nr:sorting nexin-13-like isoform X2 [Anneissia japonica]